MSETPPPPVQPAPGEIPPVPAVEAVRIRAIVHNAADRALSARGYWVPLRVRIGIAETVLAALAVYGYAVVPSESAGDRSDGDAPTRGCEAPGGGRDAVSRVLRSSDDGMASEGRTALRDRYARAIYDAARSHPPFTPTPEQLADGVLAVRDDELAALRADLALEDARFDKLTDVAGRLLRRAEQAEAALLDLAPLRESLAAEDRLRRERNGWRAQCEQAEAALARVRSLAEEWRVTPLAYGKPPTPGHIWRRAGNALLEALDVPADGEQPPTPAIEEGSR